MIAPLLVILLVGCGCAWWAWDYQQRALRVLRHRPSHVPPAGATTTAVPQTADPRPAGGPEVAPARVAVQQLERAAPTSPSSVLGWEAFALVSTLVLDGTVLLACRRQADEPTRPVPAEDATLVLLIGDDDRSALAVDLLEGWRRAGATLRLRPTTVAGAIEVFDGHRSAIRAALLAG